MDSFQQSKDDTSYEIPPIMNPPPQIFGGYGPSSPLSASFTGNFLMDDPNGLAEDSNDPKRRRIARVYIAHTTPISHSFTDQIP
jgi:hypothetical protein